MPPRSTRASTATTEAPPPTRTRAKRAASPVKEAPVKKRVLKTAAAKVNEATVNGKPESKKPESKKPKPVKEKAPPRAKRPAPVGINALPAVPAPVRPPLHLFGWGSADMCQLAMEYAGEISKPRKNAFVVSKIKEGAFGGSDAGVEAIAAGGFHTLFVDEKGAVWSCGVNDNGSLGRVTKTIPDPKNDNEALEVDEQTSQPLYVPVPIQSLLDESFRAVKIYAGDSFSAAISDKGELRAWGTFSGNQGLVGFSSNSRKQYQPVPLLVLKDEQWVSAAAGNNHLILLTSLGNIYTLGTGEEGQLGRRVIERRKISGTMPEKIVLGARSRKAVVVGAGNNHSFAVDEDGTTWGWGVNSKGQTGTGVSDPSIDREVHAPKKVVGLSKEELHGATIVQIAGGDLHTLFLASDGRVFACGLAEEGRLGLAEDDKAFKDAEYSDFIPEPTLVTFPDSTDPIVHIACGTNNNLAVSQHGALYSWGRQVVGELGLGDEDLEFQRTPAVVVRREGGSWSAIQAACGGQHCLALLQEKS